MELTLEIILAFERALEANGYELVFDAFDIDQPGVRDKLYVYEDDVMYICHDESGSWIYQYASLQEALDKEDFRERDWTARRFAKCHLSGANLRGIVARWSVWDDVCLRGANMENAVLRDANMGKSDLSYVNLSRADLRGANLADADIFKAELNGADLGEAEMP